MTLTLIPIAIIVLVAIIANFTYLKLADYLTLYDVVHSRSSHSGEVISSGGIIFGVIFIIYLSFSYYGDPSFIDSDFFWTLFFSALLFCSIGFVDDLIRLKPNIRLVSQIIACLMIALILTPSEWNLYQAWPINYSITLVIVFFYLLAFVNFFNFMDGINGLASFQALFVLIPMSFLGYYFSVIYQVLGILILVFLAFNFPKAKMFMGDSGSYFLGIFLASNICYHTFLTDTNIFFALNTLLIVFWIDPGVTLLIRIAKNENILNPHNQHLYQKITRLTGSHFKTVAGFVIFYLLILVPIAYLCYSSEPAISAAIFLLLSMTMLIVFSFFQIKFNQV